MRRRTGHLVHAHADAAGVARPHVDRLAVVVGELHTEGEGLLGVGFLGVAYGLLDVEVARLPVVLEHQRAGVRRDRSGPATRLTVTRRGDGTVPAALPALLAHIKVRLHGHRAVTVVSHVGTNKRIVPVIYDASGAALHLADDVEVALVVVALVILDRVKRHVSVCVVRPRADLLERGLSSLRHNTVNFKGELSVLQLTADKRLVRRNRQLAVGLVRVLKDHSVVCQGVIDHVAFVVGVDDVIPHGAVAGVIRRHGRVVDHVGIRVARSLRVRLLNRVVKGLSMVGLRVGDGAKGDHAVLHDVALVVRCRVLAGRVASGPHDLTRLVVDELKAELVSKEVAPRQDLEGLEVHARRGAIGVGELLFNGLVGLDRSRLLARGGREARRAPLDHTVVDVLGDLCDENVLAALERDGLARGHRTRSILDRLVGSRVVDRVGKAVEHGRLPTGGLARERERELEGLVPRGLRHVLDALGDLEVTIGVIVVHKVVAVALAMLIGGGARHVLLHGIDDRLSAVVVLRQVGERVVPGAVDVGADRLGGVVFPVCVEVHLDRAGTLTRGVPRPRLGSGHLGRLGLIDVRQRERVAVKDGVRVVPVRQRGNLLERIDDLGSVIVEIGQRPKASVPVVALVQSERVVADPLGELLRSGRPVGIKPHGDAVRPFSIAVVAIVPDLLNVDLVVDEADLRVVVADEVVHALGRARLRVDGRKIDVVVGVGVVLDERRRLIGLRGLHVDVGGNHGVGLQDKVPATLLFACVDGDGRHLAKIRLISKLVPNRLPVDLGIELLVAVGGHLVALCAVVELEVLDGAVVHRGVAPGRLEGRGVHTHKRAAPPRLVVVVGLVLLVRHVCVQHVVDHHVGGLRVLAAVHGQAVAIVGANVDVAGERLVVVVLNSLSPTVVVVDAHLLGDASPCGLDGSEVGVAACIEPVLVPGARALKRAEKLLLRRALLKRLARCGVVVAPRTALTLVALYGTDAGVARLIGYDVVNLFAVLRDDGVVNRRVKGELKDVRIEGIWVGVGSRGIRYGRQVCLDDQERSSAVLIVLDRVHGLDRISLSEANAGEHRCGADGQEIVPGAARLELKVPVLYGLLVRRLVRDEALELNLGGVADRGRAVGVVVVGDLALLGGDSLNVGRIALEAVVAALVDVYNLLFVTVLVRGRNHVAVVPDTPLRVVGAIKRAVGEIAHRATVQQPEVDARVVEDASRIGRHLRAHPLGALGK